MTKPKTDKKPAAPPQPESLDVHDEVVRNETIRAIARSLRVSLGQRETSTMLMSELISKLNSSWKTEKEKKILEAAQAWANAERELRRLNDLKDAQGCGGPVFGASWPVTYNQPTPEAKRRVVVTADYTEQMLLDAVFGY